MQNIKALNLIDWLIEISEGYRHASQCSSSLPAFSQAKSSINQATAIKTERMPLTTEKNIKEKENQLLSRLMRINHTGEICAQALYQAQMRFAKNQNTLAFLTQSKKEEEAHLGWCHQNIKQLGGRISYLNPFWYGASYLIAAFLAQKNDVISLGFTYHTEEQVSAHLQKHLNILQKMTLSNPNNNTKNILEKMQQEENEHGQKALELGGKIFPLPARLVMKALAKAMTTTTYYI